MLGGTGFHARKVASHALQRIAHDLEQVHVSETMRETKGAAVGDRLLALVITHYSREPRPGIGRPHPRGLARIVEQARAFIELNLPEPISVDDIAAACSTSRRTLFRAFASVLVESPQSYVHRIRLHRIRRDLASDAEMPRSVAHIANHWGIGELGRLSVAYRAQFGERPSETLARHR